MAGRKKKTPEQKAAEEAEIKETVETVTEMAQEDGVDPLTEAARLDIEEKKRTLESIKYDRMDEQGRIAPTPEEVFDDDLRTEADIIAETEAKLIADLVAILKVPKTKDSVMTFTMYSTPSLVRRYFLLDVDGTAFRKGWALYKEVKGNDPVAYVDMVMHIMDLEIPRLHRAVDWAPLN